MTDRVPGAPGQYKMTVSAEEAQKLLTGEAVTVTLVRNDQPLVEGTPYNKASVLPDDLAAQICPNVTDPTPADALRGLLPKAGGVMTGAINMNNKGITNLPEPSAESDAATLKTVITKGGGAKLLWTNSRPTSSFAAQSITISGVSDYVLLIAECILSTQDANYVTSVFLTSGRKSMATIGTTIRSLEKTSSGVTVSDCYVATGGTTTENTELIPYRIYGIKATT